MNDNDCCTEAGEILANIWETFDPLSKPPKKTSVIAAEIIDAFFETDWRRIGAFLAAQALIDVDTDPPDESNRNLEGEDL